MKDPKIVEEMKVIKSIEEMQVIAKELRNNNKIKIALIPTMGSLHEGHISLIQKAYNWCDSIIVSIFVNPKQFGPSEDFSKYPRNLDRDIEICKEQGVDYIFSPLVEALYPDDFSTYILEDYYSKNLCGISRPNHFKGVATICIKLYNIINPHFAFFGQKDAQQSAVIKKVVYDLNLSVEIVIVDTIRDEDGLALSSRNLYLSKSQRQEAIAINGALNHAKRMVEDGINNPDRITAEITHLLSSKRRIRIIYINVVDIETMHPVSSIIRDKHMVCIAVWLDDIRLIDNIVL